MQFPQLANALTQSDGEISEWCSPRRCIFYRIQRDQCLTDAAVQASTRRALPEDRRKPRGSSYQ